MWNEFIAKLNEACEVVSSVSDRLQDVNVCDVGCATIDGCVTLFPVYLNPTYFGENYFKVLSSYEQAMLYPLSYQ